MKPSVDKTAIDPKAWQDYSQALEIDEATLRAVAEVEASGSGFLPASRDKAELKPKILFEGHAFHRLTGGRFSKQHPNISYPKWDRKQYSGSLAGEWRRLEAACQLDRTAALQSASWGLFQIMGFNYPYCGCSEVEAFVAAQYEGATQQLAQFVKFVSRKPFLEALHDQNWAVFAAAYNGPAYAKNQYDTKLAAAHRRWKDKLAGTIVSAAPAKAATPARKTAAVKAAKPIAPGVPPGREEFPEVAPIRRGNQRKRNVRPDPVDLRDWEYRPSIAVSPANAWLPHDPQPTKHQEDTNACTGFALATVIQYLLDHGKKPVEVMSGHMLYSMARRYDEWAEEDETIDSGSSLRGALKGWSKHGASCERLWCLPDMPPANIKEGDWWVDAVKRPMGAYYRIDPTNIRDIHVALAEVGAVYASALTHAGWDTLTRETPSPAPTSVEELKDEVIPTGTGARDQGHAFAIVGYTAKGFVVQNSWGQAWGRGGFAVLPYDDWLANAMDCWVVQLGVVTAEHDEVANAHSLRVEPSGRAVVARDATLADHEISPFVVNMENDGRLSQRGRFRTDSSDLQLLVEQHLAIASERWKSTGNGHIDVAIYAHGGLTNEDAAAKTARVWIPHLYSHQIFPIFLMWETGAFDTLGNIFEDAVKSEAEKTGGARWDRFRRDFAEWRNERMEGLARPPGRKLWGQMKQNADALSNAKMDPEPGVVQLFKLFKNSSARVKLPKRIRLHLIGHSAGAIVHSHLGARAIAEGLEVASISLLAPAVRLKVFNDELGGNVAKQGIPVLLANLTDAAERADDTCKPYGHSLLYLVSRSFEDHEETPLLGMERHLVPALPAQAWGANVHQLRCPGHIWAPGSAATRATTHGGMDDDPAVREAVADFIKKRRQV